MDHPHNFVVVGDNKGTPGKFFTQLQPIKLEENVGMAITSIFHGSIHNITSENQKIIYEVAIVKIPTDSALIITGPVTTIVRESFKIDEGNYSSTLSIVKTIAKKFEKSFPYELEEGEEEDETDTDERGGRNRGRNRNPRRVKPDNPPRLEIDESLLDVNKEGFIKITPRYMSIVADETTPWKMLGFLSSNTVSENITFQVQNVNYSNTIRPAFLYSNIIENSYINGKLSRNLSTIPLSWKSGWSFYEFKYPVYVSIDVKEFSKILLELRDINAKPIQFDPSFKTILNLHIKPINRSDNSNLQSKENGSL